MAMDSKNNIKKRMISHAAKAWGLSRKEIEKNDPIVPMLIDACAGELANISRSIGESKDKIGGRIMELLTPEKLSSPYPARAVVSSMPMDNIGRVNENTEFYFNKSVVYNTEEQDIEIFFTPIGETRLFKGQIRYFAIHDKIFHKSGITESDTFCKAKRSKSIEASTIWLGLHIPKAIQSLDGIKFYFDLDSNSAQEDEVFFNGLSESTWDISGHQLTYERGFNTEDRDVSDFQVINASSEFSKAIAVCNHVNKFYQKHFYSFKIDKKTGLNLKELTCKYPDFFTKIFDEDSLKEIEGNILWIKIGFSQHIAHGILQKMNCAINCFPVINRRFEKVTITGKEKIVPLAAEKNEMYFDLKDIRSDDNLKIIMDGKNAKEEEEIAILTLRKDNIGRINSRNTFELIQQMVNVYREEYMSFSDFKSIDQDTVENLKKAILPFESILDDLQDIPLDSMPYLMLKTNPEDEDSMVEVDYWLTNGALANNINKDENLKHDSADLVRDKIFLMTTTSGGIDRKRNEELANDFRYALISRDRIVSRADIRALCYKIFEKSIKHVEIKEGVSSSTKPGDGLRRTIDIHVKLTSDHKLKKESIEFFKEDILTHLIEKSSNILLYRLFVS